MQNFKRGDWLSGIANGSVHLHTVPGACGFANYSDWAGFADRTIDYSVLYMLLRGTIHATFHDTGQRVVVPEGTLILVSPGVRHSLHPADPQHGITTYHFRFYAETSNTRARLMDDYVHVSYGEHRALQRDITRLYDLIRTDSRYATLQQQALWMLTFTEMFTADEWKKTTAFSPKQRAILDGYIAQHIHERPTAHDLAQVVGYTQIYFSRMFKKSYGVSPRRWILLERIRYATVMLLETEKQITQIAHELGYMDIYLFSRQFKSVQDCSPQAYRQVYSK